MTSGRSAPAGRRSGRMPGGRAIPLLFLLLAVLVLSACQSVRPRFREESIQRINHSPASHGGRAVILHGVTAEPVGRATDGTSLGAYLLRDGNGKTIRVITRRPPRAGVSCRVSGFVGQDPENALRPLVLEVQRSRPRHDLLLIVGLLVLVLGSLPLGVARFSRINSRSLHPPGAGPPAADGPLLRPGRDCVLQLVVVAGPDTGKQHAFSAERILVGRPGKRRNDLSLDDQTVSREQAVILRDHKVGGYKIRNEGRTQTC